jgi:hypothetical protein
VETGLRVYELDAGRIESPIDSDVFEKYGLWSGGHVCDVADSRRWGGMEVNLPHSPMSTV